MQTSSFTYYSATGFQTFLAETIGCFYFRLENLNYYTSNCLFYEKFLLKRCGNLTERNNLQKLRGGKAGNFSFSRCGEKDLI
jgi:hypothetical protein